MTTRSLERLASGHRINRAADDAAGLAISEGLSLPGDFITPGSMEAAYAALSGSAGEGRDAGGSDVR